jgi:cell division protein FtsW
MKKTGTKGSMDFVLFASILMLLAIGIVMVYSASSYSSAFSKECNYDDMFYLKKQLLWAAIGIVLMFIVVKFDYHKISKYTTILMVISFVLLVVVFKFKDVNGAKRWIPLGFASVQPSEIAKYVIVLYMAKSIANKGEKMKTFLYGVLPYLLVSGLYAGIILVEPNMSIATVIMMVTLILLLVAGVKWSQMLSLFGVLGGLAGVFIIIEPYRLTRLMSFTNPWAVRKDSGYQLVQSLLALGSGGISGVGLGASRQKMYYIPEPHTDFILAIIGEELGFIGCAIIIILFLIFIWRGIKVALNAKDTYGTLLAIGITSIIAIQAIINIAVVTGSMPVTGVPLPFISYGGSSLVFNMIAVGVLLNISRQSNRAN